MSKTKQTVTAPVQVLVKLLAKGKLPTREHSTDAGFDLYAAKTIKVGAGGVAIVPSGVMVNIPPGYFGKVYERSGVSVRRPLMIKAGVIDSGYTGEIGIVVYNHGDMPEVIDEGTKLAQLVIHELPTVELIQVEDLGATERAAKGFGSSDIKI